jgi:hypothetical protein
MPEVIGFSWGINAKYRIKTHLSLTWCRVRGGLSCDLQGLGSHPIVELIDAFDFEDFGAI